MRKILLIISIVGGVVFYLCYRTIGTSEESNALTPGNFKPEKEIFWNDLQKYDANSINIPKEIKEINGEMVKIPGFIIPLEDNEEHVSEFLFVPSPMSCIHVPPPPPNQIIYVRMATGNFIKMSYGPVWLKGKFSLQEASTPETKATYSMIGYNTVPYS